jgi:hypothetical protein
MTKRSFKRKCIWSFAKLTIKIRMILCFILQLAASYFKGMRLSDENREITLLLYVVLFINYLIFSLEFSIYGYLVTKILKKAYS